MSKRHWTAEQPKNYKNIKDSRVQWQPERLSFEQGLKEAPIPALVIYGVILAALLALVIIALNVLPASISVGQLFDLYSKEFPTVLFLGMIYSVQVYLVYRDIVRRSMSRHLCVIPVMYFVLAVYIILYL